MDKIGVIITNACVAHNDALKPYCDSLQAHLNTVLTYQTFLKTLHTYQFQKLIISVLKTDMTMCDQWSNLLPETHIEWLVYDEPTDTSKILRHALPYIVSEYFYLLLNPNVAQTWLQKMVEQQVTWNNEMNVVLTKEKNNASAASFVLSYINRLLPNSPDAFKETLYDLGVYYLHKKLLLEFESEQKLYSYYDLFNKKINDYKMHGIEA